MQVAGSGLRAWVWTSQYYLKKKEELSDGLWYRVVYEGVCVMRIRNELTIDGSMICSRGLNEFYCIWIILDYGELLGCLSRE